jgi:hypothetical protein
MLKKTVEDDMKSRATRTDRSGASHQDDIVSKERLDDWLDAALAGTFPASDPVASPPSETAAIEDAGSGSNQPPADGPPADGPTSRR